MIKRIFSVILCAVLLLSCTALADESYTVSEKLIRQIEAGSGFSADLTLDITDAAGTSRLQMPFNLRLNYIQDEAGEDHRAELSLLDGENIVSTLNIRSYDGTVSFQADLLSPDWFKFSLLTESDVSSALLDTLLTVLGLSSATEEENAPAEATDETAEVTEASAETTDETAATTEAPAEATETSAETTETSAEATETSAENADPSTEITDLLSVDGLLALTGTPDLANIVLNLYQLYESQDLSTLEEELTTRLDLWLEGYRTEPVMDKDEKRGSTISMSYTVPASALKAEMKTLLLEVLETPEWLALLSAPLSEEQRALYLNPDWQRYYFAAIDALPLEGDMVIERSLSITTGETQSLTIRLPLRDAATGNAELSYSRVSGYDSPDNHSLAITTDSGKLSFSFMEYTTEEGMLVYSGTLLRETQAGGDTLDFILTTRESEKTADNGDTLQSVDYTLKLQPGESPLLLKTPIECSLSIAFTSANAKKTATYVEGNAELLVGEETKLVFTFSGKTRKKWAMDELNDTPRDLLSLDFSDLAALAAGFASNLSGLLREYQTK